MEKSVKMQVRKDLNNHQQQNVIKLKGNLISRGYTEIIHISDQDDEFHINFFETSTEFKNEVQEYINAFITKENLEGTIKIFK
jgi:YesN/AraC family two-component response regulator